MFEVSRGKGLKKIIIDNGGKKETVIQLWLIIKQNVILKLLRDCILEDLMCEDQYGMLLNLWGQDIIYLLFLVQKHAFANSGWWFLRWTTE